jgi:hypothetical protein
MNSSFRKALAINEVGSVDTILKRFRPTVGMNEGNHEALTKTLKSTSQVPITGETVEIIIDLSDGKNIHVTEFNRSYFELYFNIDIDVFQGRFPIPPTDDLPEWLDGEATWDNWTTIPAFVDIAKITYLLIGFKNTTDYIKYYRIQHNGRDIGPTTKDNIQLESYLLNVMRQKSDKENKANSFTLWEDAHSHNVSVCGQYISMWEIYQASLIDFQLLLVLMIYFHSRILEISLLAYLEILNYTFMFHLMPLYGAQYLRKNQ